MAGDSIDFFIFCFHNCDMENLTAVIEQKARALGFNHVGFIPAAPGEHLDAYLRWVENEMYGRMGYMARPDRIIRRQDLNVILPDVQTLICVGMDYHTLQLPSAIANDPSRGRISNYAWNLDYHDIMTPRLQELADWLQATLGTKSRVYVDTGAILERDHAQAAGLGFVGKNTMLINPRGGSYFFLGEILTTLAVGGLGSGGDGERRGEIGDFQPVAERLEIDAERSRTVGDLQPLVVRLAVVGDKMPSCGSCRRCLEACPTGAFVGPYVLDARRCISYLTIEMKDWIPRELRPFMGNWIYGCDICQEVCPFNRFAGEAEEVGFYPAEGQEQGRWGAGERRFVTDGHEIGDWVWEETTPSLLGLLALDEAGFRERFGHSPIKRIKRRKLIRNVCVAVGNWGSDTAVPQLTTLLSDPEAIIRGHAAWALHQIGTVAAKTAVTQAILHETDADVLRELELS